MVVGGDTLLYFVDKFRLPRKNFYLRTQCYQLELEGNLPKLAYACILLGMSVLCEAIVIQCFNFLVCCI